jgi:hypothetical protein
VAIHRSPPQDTIVLDACCAINLYESGCCEAILGALPYRVALAQVVYEKELLSLTYGPEAMATPGAERSRPTLNALVTQGLLTLVMLESDAEVNAFVNFAVALDDGEAMTAAIALTRGWIIATDDSKSIKFLQRMAPALPIVSTLELMRHWAGVASPSRDTIKTALANVRAYARYRPNRNHPLYAWWQSFVKD